MIIAHRMIHTATHAAKSGVGSDGEPTWAASSSLACRIEPALANPDGTESKYTHRIIVQTSGIGIDDRIWLPGDSATDALARAVRDVREVPALDGATTVWEVML